jgi:hypothetical protein
MLETLCNYGYIRQKYKKKHLTYKYYTLIRVTPINDWFNKGWKNHYPVDSAIQPIQPAHYLWNLNICYLSFVSKRMQKLPNLSFQKPGGGGENKLWWAHNWALLSGNYREFRDLKSWKWHYFASKFTMFLASLCWLNKE